MMSKTSPGAAVVFAGAVAAAAGGQQTAASPATQPAAIPGLHPVLLSLMAAGVCVGAVWLVRCLARPRRLTLARTPGRSNALNPLHLLAVAALWVAASGILAELTRGRQGPAEAEALLLRTLAGQVVWLAGSILVAAVTFRHGLRRGLGLSARRWLYDSLRSAAAYLIVLPVCVGLALVMSRILPEQLQPPHALLKAQKVLPPAWKAVTLLSAVVLAPLSEELFFRGLVQSMFRRYLQSPWASIVLGSLFFTAIHVPQYHHMPSLFALSLVLGYNYERTGRLMAPLLTHALFNLVNLLIAGG